MKRKKPLKVAELPPLVTFRGEGLSPEFENGDWNQIRNEIYRGHGAEVVVSDEASRTKTQKLIAEMKANRSVLNRAGETKLKVKDLVNKGRP